MAVSVLMDPSLCQTKRMHVDIEKNGMTRAGQKGSPNATVALETDPAQFINYYVSLFTSPTRTSQSRNSSAAEESSY
jgi:inosine-uridine nucleoside N-ribohydrolase